MSVKITDGFDPGDDEKVISVLNKWNGGVISDKLFTKISEITPQTAVITVIFRGENKNLETLLLKRPDDDPVWKGMLNLPGKMFRKIDFGREDNIPENGPIGRIEQNELDFRFTKKPEFAGIAFQDTKRGPITALIYVTDETIVTPKDGEWHKIEGIEGLKNMIETEFVAINVAQKHYLASLNHLPSLYPVEFQKKSA
jgi:hypothetical protein